MCQLHRRRLPDVLAYEEPGSEAAAVDDRRLVAGVEVALLVEHLVVGELGLAMDGRDLASRNERRRVIDACAGVLGEADQDACLPELGAQLRESRLDLPAETAMEQQILRRVARERQLGIEH